MVRRMWWTGLMVAWCLGGTAIPGRAADAWIVEQGQARAQIVTSEQPTRLVKLAAEELRDAVRKISGAELPIVRERHPEYPVAIYVGRSEGTERIGITEEGLADEAFRVVSGPDWLVLLGRDVEFEPIEPWAHTHGDRPRAQAEWEALSGLSGRPPALSHRAFHKSSGIWAHDESGSLQAVYEFLRDLGVRWYMPGALGEVVPERESIALPAVDKTIAPDFRVRDLRLGNVPGFPWEDFLWYWRLGLNSESLGGAHGMRAIMAGQTLREKKPEFFAMYGGRRSDGSHGGRAHVCFSSEGVRQEVLRYARTAFDHYNRFAVSIMPEDGYRHCECERCLDMSPSDRVWTFVDSVARELYKTHPDRLVVCGAYTAYREPPQAVEKFSPNVVVRISWTRPGLDDDERWAEFRETVDGWLPKVAPGHLARNANVQWSASPRAPVIFPRSIAREFKAMKGISIGDNSSVPRSPDQRWGPPGLAHLNHYVTARYLRDADQDLDALLGEYYTLFYGPAADAMRKAFEYAERVYNRERKPSTAQPLETLIEFVKRLEAARAAAGDTVYGARVQLVLDDMETREELEQALAEREAAGDPRADAPVVLADEPATGSKAPVYRLRDNKTGEAIPDEIATTFHVTWEDKFMVFDVQCHEPDLANMPITANIWGGDSVAILLETPVHAYYHLEVNPDGVLFDADWSRGRRPGMENWNSMAEVTTERGDDFWRLVVRIPVVPVAEGADDPLHFVVGDKPTADEPWFFNIGRSRGLDAQRRVFAFSPTEANYHVPLRFAKLRVAK